MRDLITKYGKIQVGAGHNLSFLTFYYLNRHFSKSSERNFQTDWGLDSNVVPWDTLGVRFVETVDRNSSNMLTLFEERMGRKIIESTYQILSTSTC